MKLNRKNLRLYFENGIKLTKGFNSSFDYSSHNAYYKGYFDGYIDAMKDAMQDLKLKKR